MKVNINKGIKWTMRHWKAALAAFVAGGLIGFVADKEYQTGLEDGASANAEGFKRALQKRMDNPEMTDDELEKEAFAGAQQYFDDTYGK